MPLTTISDCASAMTTGAAEPEAIKAIRVFRGGAGTTIE